MAFQDHLRTLGELATEAHAAGWVTTMPAMRECVHVAVIGEIKRGKSTFLNALMGEKVFPSRSSVCTTAVTFLEDGDPAIEAIYRPELNRPPETRRVLEGENIFECLQEMVAKPNQMGKKGNPKAQDLDAVVVKYPNRFATDGVRLVDTPGVNDPESWREEITFQFLPQVDAALMLLDPQQPLSRSEMDFLRNRATKAVKDQLLIVVSRCDEVKPADLEKSLARIRRELEPLLPNVRVLPVAGKLALNAKMEGTPLPESWKEFEAFLDRFLHAGKAGALLLSRAQAIHDEVEGHQRMTLNQMDSLAGDSTQEQARLGEERKELDRIQAGLTAMVHRSRTIITSHQEDLNSKLDRFIASQRNSLHTAQGEDFSSFPSRFLRDLQELRQGWMEECTDRMEATLQQEIKALVGVTNQVKGFRIPAMAGTGKAPVLTVPTSTTSSSYLPAVLGGMVAGLFGGPLLIAGVAFLTRTLSATSELSQQESAVAQFRRECEGFLQEASGDVRRDSEALLRSVAATWAPQFFHPIQAEIERQGRRVAETQADFGKGEEERNHQRQVLLEGKQRLDDMLVKTQAFIHVLQAAGEARSAS